MADISMCEGEGCEVKNTCYRFTAKPNKFLQSYVMPTVQPGGCDLYWNINKQKINNKQLITN